MANIEREALSSDQQRFVDDIAALFAPWGMPASEARVYGYLLLNQETRSLDQMAAALKMSKVSAWKAARSLEGFGHIRRYGKPGSKQALYGPTDNFADPLLEQCALLHALGSMLARNASTVASGAATDRLQAMARFYLSLGERMKAAIDELSAHWAGPPR